MFITSPRSLQALDNQGINQEDLKRKSKSQVKAMLRQNGRACDDNAVRVFGDHLEKRRKAKLEILIKVKDIMTV